MKFKFLFFFFLIFPFSVDAKIIDIPFISQVLPGDWNSTLNCGQTSYYMADKFLSNDSKLDSEDIKKIDDFLYNKFSDPVRNYNGYYTNTTKLKSVAENLGKYENVFINKASNDFDDIKTEIDNGNLIIPLVRISMKLDKDGHFMLMTGFDDTYIYFNDPGKTFGKGKKYLIDDFLNVWKSENYNYLILKKKKNNTIEDVTNKISDVNKNNKDNILENNNVSNSISTISNPPIYNYLTNLVKPFQDIVLKNIDEQSTVNSASNLILNNGSNIKNENVDIANNNVGCGYGYGYGDSLSSSETTTNEGGGSSKVIYLPEFEFKNNYQENKLVIPFEFNFNNVATDISKYYFKMDYKINKDGKWENLFDNYNFNYYKYYVKTNNDTYYFRLKVCDLKNNCSDFKEISQKVSLKSASDMTLIGYDGNDVVMDRPEYFNVCFDVDPEQIILITKGTKIMLSPNCTMSIKGYLFAMGESDEKIKITSVSDSYQSYWSFIKFENSFGSILNNVEVTNGGYYFPKGYTYPKFIIDNSIVTLNGVDFSKSFGQSAVYVQNNSAFYMLNSSVRGSSVYPGVFIKESIGVLDNNIFDENLYGIYLSDVDERLSITNNKISNSRYYPIYGENGLAIIKDNLFLNNKYDILFEKINLQKEGEYFIRKGIYDIDEMNVGAGVNLNIESGSVFKLEQDGGVINVYGSIKAIGTVSEPIIFTSINDNEYGGVVTGYFTGFHHNNWAGINLKQTSNNTEFSNCIFRYGGKNNTELTGMINIENSADVKIANSMFEKSYYGLNIFGSKNINISNCNISNNFYGIVSNNSSNVVVENNYYSANLINELIN